MTTLTRSLRYSPQGTPSGERLPPGCRIRSLSVFDAPDTLGTVIDPETLPQGSARRGYLHVWVSHPFVRMDDGRLMAYPCEFLEKA